MSLNSEFTKLTVSGTTAVDGALDSPLVLDVSSLLANWPDTDAAPSRPLSCESLPELVELLQANVAMQSSGCNCHRNVRLLYTLSSLKLTPMPPLPLTQKTRAFSGSWLRTSAASARNFSAKFKKESYLNGFRA